MVGWLGQGQGKEAVKRWVPINRRSDLRLIDTHHLAKRRQLDQPAYQIDRQVIDRQVIDRQVTGRRQADR